VIPPGPHFRGEERARVRGSCTSEWSWAGGIDAPASKRGWTA